MKNYHLVCGVSNHDIVRFILKVENFKNLENKIKKIIESNVITYKEDCKCCVTLYTNNLSYGRWEYAGLITTNETSIDRYRQKRHYQQHFSIYIIETRTNKNLPPILTYKNALIGRTKSGKIFDPLTEALLIYNEMDVDSNLAVHKYKVKLEMISTGTKL